MKAMEAYAYNQISQTDLYNVTKEFKEFTQQIWSAAPEVTDNNAKEYLNSCKDYMLIKQTTAESLLEYLNSWKASDLSAVQENIEYCVIDTEAAKTSPWSESEGHTLTA